MDSLNKRINFLNEVINKLGLEKVTAVHEEQKKWQLISRTDNNMTSVFHVRYPTLLYCANTVCHLLQKAVLFVSYKSADSDAEIQEGKKAISILGGKLVNIDKFKLPDSDLGRALVCIKKVKDTPKNILEKQVRRQSCR